MAKRWIAQGTKLALCAALCAGPLFAADAVADQPVKAATGAAPRRAHPLKRARKRAGKPSPATPAPQIVAAPPMPVAPPPPNWPAKSQPAAATVVWDSQGLRVDATNSSLSQILREISTDTGAKLEGPTPGDVRVFGTYGPGPANDVISQLLNGTGFNVLMVGDQGSGAPRQIVLSSVPSGPAPQNNARMPNNANEEDYEPEPPPQPEQQQQINGGFVPPQPQNQQQMQEMQMRQEQLQQQMRNQMLQQQGQPVPPDTQAPMQQH